MIDDGPRRWREIRAVAGLEALDGLRSRRQLIVRALTPVVLFACLAGLTLALRGVDTRNHPQPYDVVVEGDVAGARQTLAQLRPDRLTFRPVDDARLATTNGAEAGVRLPPGLDEAMARGDAVTVDVYTNALDGGSRAAAALLRSAIVDLHAQQVRGQLAELPSGGAAPGGFTLDLTNVERTAQGTRSLTSQLIPGLLCLQAALLVAGTANRLVSRRTRGVLVAQLLLPVSRRNLALAKGLGELVVGFVTAAPIMVAVLGFGAVLAFHDGNALQAVTATVATFLAAVVLFALTTTVGVLIGTASRTQEQVSLATGSAVVLAALVATTIGLSTVPVPPALSLIPFAGTIGQLRVLLDGNGSFAWFAVSLATTLIGALAVTTLGGRSLDAQRVVMRSG